MRPLIALSLLIASGIAAKAQNGIMHQNLGGTFDYGTRSNLDSPPVHSLKSQKGRSDNAGISSTRKRHGRSQVTYDPNKIPK